MVLYTKGGKGSLNFSLFLQNKDFITLRKVDHTAIP